MRNSERHHPRAMTTDDEEHDKTDGGGGCLFHRPSAGACIRRLHGGAIELRAAGEPAQRGGHDAQAQGVLRRRVGRSGAGHPDFGFYTAKQVQKGRPTREGQPPERGVVEVKSAADNAWLIADSEQVNRYWGRYQLLLVTNTREFVLVGPNSTSGGEVLETFRLADSQAGFDRALEKPRAFAREVGSGLGEYLCRALSHQAALTEPKGLAAGVPCSRRPRACRGCGRRAVAQGGAQVGLGAGHRTPGADGTAQAGNDRGRGLRHRIRGGGLERW